MIERTHVETVLKANGVPATAPDEIIRSVLISARWDNDDVDTALMVLKENTRTSETHVDTLHKVFHSEEHLSSMDISKLLGIDVTLRADDLVESTSQKPKIYRSQAVATGILALSIVLFAMAYAMYAEQASSLLN